MAYNAIVSKLENVRRLPDSDFLQIASCRGYQVIVGLEAKEGDTVILFPDDGQLNARYCYENNLYSHAENNKNTEKKGYFDGKGRVRCQTLRGAKSEAYVADPKSLTFTGYDLSLLEEGMMFTELNGVPICNKYVNEATLKAAKANKPKTEAGMNKESLKKLFPEHFDTVQVRHARDEDFLGLATLTLKCHGCLPENTIIKTNKGDKTIKDICDNPKGIKVESFNILESRNEWKPVSDVLVQDNIDNWYEIELENGKTIVATEEHRFYLPEFGCYRELNQLKEGDVLVVK